MLQPPARPSPIRQVQPEEPVKLNFNLIQTQVIHKCGHSVLGQELNSNYSIL